MAICPVFVLTLPHSLPFPNFPPSYGGSAVLKTNCPFFGTIIAYGSPVVFTFTLNAGDYFGDLSIMLQEKRTGSVKTMEYCEIFTLSMQDFTLIKTKYPEFKEVLTKVSSRTKEVKMELLLEGIIL